VLARHVHFAHEHLALEAELGRGGGGGEAVLPRPRLGYDADLAHALGQKGLTEGVVDLMGARIREALELQVEPEFELLVESLSARQSGVGRPTKPRPRLSISAQ
jgi:hypothetical protein